MKTVGEVSELARVTVRTLHHYDELGLLSPSERSEAGYRLYSYDDLARLQEILIWRALGFPLAEIASLLDDPDNDRLGALERQRELVGREMNRLEALADAVDAAIAAERNGTPIEETKMFDGFDPTEYEDEARERWGDAEAYQQSARRGCTARSARCTSPTSGSRARTSARRPGSRSTFTTRSCGGADAAERSAVSQ